MRDSNSLKWKTVSSLFWKLLERGGSAIITLVVQMVLARLLAPEDFGNLAIMLVFVNLCNVIVTTGFSTSLVQCKDVEDNDYSTVFWLSLVASAILYAVFFFLAPTIADYFQSPNIVWPLRFISILFFVNAYNAIQIALVQRALDFKKILVATLCAIVISGTVGIAMAFLQCGIWSLAVQQVVYQIVFCIVLFAQVPWRPRFVFEASRAKRLFDYGWKLLVSGLLETGYQSLSDFIIGKQFTVSQLGFVSQGKKIPTAVGSLLDGAIQPVMLSAISRVQDDIEYVKRLARRAMKTSTFLVAPCMALLIACADPIIRLMFGEQWGDSVPFFQMYCVVFALYPIHTTNLQVINGVGRSDLFLVLEIVKKVIGVALVLVGAFVFRDVYVLVALYMLSGFVSVFINAHPNKRLISYTYFEQCKDVLPNFILAIVAAAISFPVGFIALPDIVQVILQTCIMAIVYLGAAKLLHLEALEYLIATLKELIGR